MPPGWQKTWHCGVRAGDNNKLVGFIGAIPCKLQVHDKEIKCVEINFLCVHKKLRAKRLAPVLIKEITRRVNLKGIFQATYTAGVVIPKPIAQCRYHHRTLNPKKLIDTGFSALAKNMNMARTIKLYKVADHPTHNLIPLQDKHIKSAYKLLTDRLKKYPLHPIFSEAEFKHFMLPREDIIYTYVLLNDDNQVTDLMSFYNLPSTVVHHPVHNQIKAAYAFYNVATTIPLKDLMSNALIMAKKVPISLLFVVHLGHIHFRQTLMFLMLLISWKMNHSSRTSNLESVMVCSNITFTTGNAPILAPLKLALFFNNIARIEFISQIIIIIVV